MSQQINKIVVVGATSAMAEACTQLWLKKPLTELILIGRDESKLNIIAADLKVRSPITNVQCVVTDFLNPASIQSEVNNTFLNGPVDIVLIAHGTLPNQQECQLNLNLAYDAMNVNAVSPVLFAEAFANKMEEVNHGKLVVIGSVAGDRGRKSNYIYGASKGLVTRYVQGLQHRLANTKVIVILVKPGPTDTPMTATMKANGLKLAPLNQVAHTIVAGVTKNKRTIYAPIKWQLIMLIIQHLPHFIFKKLDI